jgi:hypothetical protein
LYFQKKKAASLAWTTTYRRAHKKDQTGEQAKRKRRNLNSKKPRAVAGVSLEVRSLPPSRRFVECLSVTSDFGPDTAYVFGMCRAVSL